MSESKKKTSSLITWLMFALAVGLLLFSTIGSARAALSIESEVLKSDYRMHNIGVGLGYSGKVFMQDLIGSDEQVIPGKIYDLPVSIANTGDIDEYVRVTVYKYWIKNGKKDASLDPSFIEITFADTMQKDSSWSSPTGESVVFYASNPLTAGGALDIIESVKVSDSILKTAQTQKDGKKTTTTYVFDGAQFCIEIVADGVQTHNAKDAIRSAWGKTVSVGTDGGPISLG